MDFTILGEIKEAETFATGQGIRDLSRLRKAYGNGRWRKRKGIANIQLSNGILVMAELHWYEANGIGKKEFKIKYILDE